MNTEQRQNIKSGAWGLAVIALAFVFGHGIGNFMAHFWPVVALGLLGVLIYSYNK